MLGPGQISRARRPGARDSAYALYLTHKGPAIPGRSRSRSLLYAICLHVSMIFPQQGNMLS